MKQPIGRSSANADVKYRELIDPSYQEIVEAVTELVEKRLISVQELNQALSYVDGLLATPLYKQGAKYLSNDSRVDRLKGRQLILANTIADLVSRILSPQDVGSFNIYGAVVANEILGLVDKILDWKAKRLLREKLAKMKQRQDFVRSGSEKSLIAEFIKMAINMSNQTKCATKFSFETPSAPQGYRLDRYVAVPLER